MRTILFTKVCICGKIVNVTTKNRLQQYCSKICSGIGIKTGQEVLCTFCNKKIYKCKTKLRKSNYCSLVCLGQGRKRIPSFCLNCNTSINNSKRKHCSRICQAEDNYKTYIERWLNGAENGYGKTAISIYIRRWLYKKYGRKCQKCGWCEINPKTKVVPININHIDGNWQNNKLENLEILCPNCHSLTENFGALNRGSGRQYRYASKT